MDMKYFHHDQIKFCSMHALNLGFTLWLLGGAIVLLDEQLGAWGGPEVDRTERLHHAYVEFHHWTSSHKIQSLRSTFDLNV